MFTHADHDQQRTYRGGDRLLDHPVVSFHHLGRLIFRCAIIKVAVDRTVSVIPDHGKSRIRLRIPLIGKVYSNFDGKPKVD